MNLPSGIQLRLASDVSYQSFGDDEDGVVLSLNSGFLYSCNATALAFLESLDGQRTFDQIVDLFAGRFAIDTDRARCDLSMLAEQLLDDQLITAST